MHHEDEADAAPACNILKRIYRVSDEVLKFVKNKVQRKDRTSPFDPSVFLKEILHEKGIKKKDMLESFGYKPNKDEIDRIRNQLFQQFFVTLRGKEVLDDAVQSYGSRLLSTALRIARRKGRSEIIAEDIKEAQDEIASTGDD